VSRRLEPLAQAHDVDAFDCGEPGLTDWLKSHARHATGQGTRTYALVEHASNSVIGYFAVAPFLIERERTPRRIYRRYASRRTGYSTTARSGRSVEAVRNLLLTRMFSRSVQPRC